MDQRVIQNSHLAYNRTGCQVSVFWYLPFSTLVRRNHKVFSVQDPFWPIFVFFGAITPVNKKKKHFLTIFWTLNLYSGATTKGWKNSIGFSDSELSAQYFEKKNSLTKSNILGARQVLTFLV